MRLSGAHRRQGCVPCATIFRSSLYKYLGSVVNSDTSIEEEIQHRITVGNKAYYANQILFKSRLVSKKSKLKLYWSIIRPTVTYACETWVLKETMKNKLMVFERKVLRKIFGPTKERRWYMENQNKR
jgi:hypothetical protein